MNQIEVKAYKGNHSLLLKLQALANSDNYSELFLGVIVHGSLGVDEEIPYSDFDGLLIVQDDRFNGPLYREFIHKSDRLINRYDPLQHHGWFVIKTSQLSDYPEWYLPIEVLRHSVALFPKKGINLEYQNKTVIDHQRSFYDLKASLERKIARGFRPRGLFELKSYLSEIMLLPTVYYQATRKKTLFKKFSFEEIRKDFEPEVYSIMDEVSSIRRNWVRREPFLKPVFLWLKNKRFFKKIARPYLAPAIPKSFQEKIDRSFYQRLALLINKMDQKINDQV